MLCMACPTAVTFSAPAILFNVVTLAFFLLPEVRILLVPLDHDSIRRRPFNTKGRIVPAHAARALRGVDLRHLVEHFRVVLKCLKAVRKTLRDVERSAILSREFEGRISFERQ